MKQNQVGGTGERIGYPRWTVAYTDSPSIRTMQCTTKRRDDQEILLLSDRLTLAEITLKSFNLPSVCKMQR